MRNEHSSSHGVVMRRNLRKSETDAGLPTESEQRASAMKAFVDQNRVDPESDPFIAFAFESAARRRNHLAVLKLANQIATKGAARGLHLLPENDFGFRGQGQRLWGLLKAALIAPHGQHSDAVRVLQEEIKALQDGDAIPTPTRGNAHTYLAAHTFVFSLLFLRRASGMPDWSARDLYNLACGLGIARCYAVNEHGSVRLAHWNKLVKEVQAHPYETTHRRIVAGPAYYLAATVTDVVRLSPENRIPTARELAAYVTATQLSRPPLPWPSRSDTAL